MPRVPGIPGPYRFFFYSFDCSEPRHVHVRRERMNCKFWLEPISLAANNGFTSSELNRIRKLVLDNLDQLKEPGMNIVVSEPRMVALKVTEDLIIAELADGRTISVPLAWSWRLSDATSEQRAHFEFIGNGEGAHWPEVDEDISAQGMLNGVPARPPKSSATS